MRAPPGFSRARCRRSPQPGTPSGSLLKLSACRRPWWRPRLQPHVREDAFDHVGEADRVWVDGLQASSNNEFCSGWSDTGSALGREHPRLADVNHPDRSTARGIVVNHASESLAAEWRSKCTGAPSQCALLVWPALACTRWARGIWGGAASQGARASASAIGGPSKPQWR